MFARAGARSNKLHRLLAVATEVLAIRDELIRIRPDLEQSEQIHKGVRVLVVKDPVTRRYFRFTEAQAEIIALMAAPVDAESVAAAAAAKLGCEVSPETIRGFFRSLEQKLLVDTPHVRTALDTFEGAAGKRKERNLLYLKLASFDPARIFDWLLPRTRWAFRPGFHLLGVLAIISGFTILITNWSELTGAVAGLFSVYGLLLIIPAIFAVITIHEFSHGLTCCHFGGKVHELGFMLIYFQPAFYCDVSDSWLFPSRRNRMWVTLAGGYAQLIVWGLCAIVWRITDTDTFINHATLAVVLYSGVQSLVNFNPLIKLDGYYMLSDYLEIPNLRAKALKTVWSRVAGAKRAGETWRDIRAQFIYGALAILFSTALLLYVYSRLYGWAVENYQLTGLIGFAMFFSYTLRKTALESLSGARAFATRLSLKKFRNLGIAAAGAAILIFGRWELKITADFKVVAPESQTVNARTEGIIHEILIREGSEVRKGDVVARMGDFSKELTLEDLNGKIVKENENLTLLLAGTRKEAIEAQETRIEAKKTELANASRNKSDRSLKEQLLEREKAELENELLQLNRQKKLLQEGLIAQEIYDRAAKAVKVREASVAAQKDEIRKIQEMEERDIALLEKDLEVLYADLKVLKSGSRPEEIDSKRKDITRLKRQRDHLEAELAKTALVAPIDGVVITPQVEKKENQLLEAGDEFCRIVDIRTVTAELLVPEKEMADVAMDYPVWIKPKGFPTAAISGKVDFISAVAQTEKDQQVVVVRSVVANDNRLLRPGMTGKAQIYAGERRIIEIISRRLIRWVRTELIPMLP